MEKKRKSVSFQENKDDEDKKGDKFKPEKPFVKVVPRDVSASSSAESGKEVVLLQVPDEVDLAKLSGKLVLKSDGEASFGTLATNPGQRFALHAEDQIYAQQLCAFVPTLGKKDLELAEVSHMLTLARETTSLSGSKVNGNKGVKKPKSPKKKSSKKKK